MKVKVKKTSKKVLDDFKKFISNVWDILQKPEMSILPGQLAFSIILSIVPIITLIGYGASYFDISMDTIIALLKNNFSDSIVDIIVPIISGDGIDIHLLIMLVSMFYFASNGASSVIFITNEIYGIEQKSFVKRRGKAILMTFLIIVLYLFILLVPVFGKTIINAIDYFHIKSFISSILSVLQGPISWIIVFVFIKLIFTLAPNQGIESSRINIGAIFTTFGWIVGTNFYSYYVSHFAKYDLFYAGLSNVMVLMLWIYFLSVIMVIGISLTTKVEGDNLVETSNIDK